MTLLRLCFISVYANLKLMKAWMLPLLIVSVLFNFVFAINKVSPSGKTNQDTMTVFRVIDGDTLVTASGDTVRLTGIDAPEYPQGCLGDQAKDRLAELVDGQTLKIEKLDKKDNFGRILAFVFLDDVLLNQTLVEEGLAKSEGTKLAYSADIIKAETGAKTLQKGIWSNLCLNPDCVIKGNVRKDNNTKIYHLPDCYNYTKIVIDESNGDKWFCTEAEAKVAGFTKSLDCPGSK